MNEEEWPSLGKQGGKVWEAGSTFAEKLQGIVLNRGDRKADEIGCNRQDNTLSEGSEHDSDMEDNEPLCVITEDENRNFPEFSFSEKMTKRLHKAWKWAVIVKLLGRNIGYKNLLSILQTLWAKRGVINVINVGNGFFVVKLSNKEDYMNALTGGPWMLFDHYLTVSSLESYYKQSGSAVGRSSFRGEDVVEDLRSNQNVQFVRAKKSGGGKKKGKGKKVMEAGVRSEVDLGEKRSDKRAREQEVGRDIMRINGDCASGRNDQVVGPVEIEIGNDGLGLMDKIITLDGSRQREDPISEIVLETPMEPGDFRMDPGDSRLAIGLAGKFWAGSAEVEVDSEMGEESGPELIGKGDGPSAYLA
ncbi:hypothetical protein K1719_034859 [Acacia pycnantha]|nr:hypothetical protein K1719_034859 [Acacia pycnantha]